MPWLNVESQERAVAVLRAALTSRRVAHAYLFTGPQGVGKTLAATTLAAALMCDDDGDDACGRCRPCTKVAQDVHPDLLTAAPEGPAKRVRIDQVRQIARSFKFPPFEGRHRIVIFPEADRLNVEAANALLKTLEEPPERTVLVLVTSSPQALLETIRSRCQRIRFSPLTKDQVSRLLMEQGVPEQDARVAAALAEGSVGRAKALIEAGMLEDRLATIAALEEVSLDRPRGLFSLASSWSSAERAAEAREAVRQRLDLLSSWYRDVLVCAAGATSDELVHGDLVDRIAAAGAHRTDALRALGHIQLAREALALHGSARLVCERLLIELCRVQR